MNDSIHICASSDCGCGMTRRDFLRMSALTGAAAASLLLFAGDAAAQNFKGDDQPVKIGYLPITDAAPLLPDPEPYRLLGIRAAQSTAASRSGTSMRK